MGVQLPTEHKYKRRLSSWKGWGCLWVLVLICPQTAKAQVTPQPGVADWVNAVLTAHPVVRARAEEARAAEADVSAARWQYWPTPSVNTDTLRGQSATVTRLSQPLWDGGKIAVGVRQSEIRLRLATMGLRETEHELAGKVLGFWQTQSVQEARLRVFERGLQSLQDLDDLMSRRTDAGVSAQADLTLARVRLMQTRADLLQARAAQTAALGQLRQLAQHEPARAQASPAPWTADMEEGVERLREIARQQHPLVDRLKWQLELQQAEFDAFKAELWPTLSLRAERQRGQIDGTLAEGRRFYANLQYSLGAGATVIPKLEAAQVRVRALEQQQEGALKELDERLLQDWHDYATLRLRLPDLESVQEAARDLTESSKRLFVTGRKSWLDLQNAVREQLQAELARAEAQAMMDALRYRLALQTGQMFWRAEGP